MPRLTETYSLKLSPKDRALLDKIAAQNAAMRIGQCQRQQDRPAGEQKRIQRPEKQQVDGQDGQQRRDQTDERTGAHAAHLDGVDMPPVDIIEREKPE